MYKYIAKAEKDFINIWMYCSHREFPTTICCAEARINLLREALACAGLVAEDADTGFLYLVLKENSLHFPG